MIIAIITIHLSTILDTVLETKVLAIMLKKMFQILSDQLESSSSQPGCAEERPTCTWQCRHSRDYNSSTVSWQFIRLHHYCPLHSHRGLAFKAGGASLDWPCSSGLCSPIFLPFSLLFLASFSLPHQLVWHISAQFNLA